MFLKYTGMNSFSVGFFCRVVQKIFPLTVYNFQENSTPKVSIKPTWKFSLAQVSILEDLAGRGIKTS